MWLWLHQASIGGFLIENDLPSFCIIYEEKTIQKKNMMSFEDVYFVLSCVRGKEEFEVDVLLHS